MAKLNFEADDYTSLISWDEISMFTPPVLSNLAKEDIKKLAENGCNSELCSFPCHTQAVERRMKEVTHASLNIATNEKRRLEILKRLESERKMSKFYIKSNFRMC